MQVEVNVQDCFLNYAQLVAEGDSFVEPIATSTWETWFYQWLEAVQSALPPALSYELCLRLTDDEEIQALNAQYRQKNQPTDVLAFAALEVNSPQLPPGMHSSMPLYLGDIVISVDTADRQARQQGHCLHTELAWLAAHGLLHLLGWDHPDDETLVAMLEQQQTLLNVVNLTFPV